MNIRQHKKSLKTHFDMLCNYCHVFGTYSAIILEYELLAEKLH